MKKVYEAWVDDGGGCIAFGPPEVMAKQRAEGVLSKEAKLLHSVEAHTMEEALKQHHAKMGWEPYRPEGEPEECPNGCGALFYPEGYGECPNCGKIC